MENKNQTQIHSALKIFSTEIENLSPAYFGMIMATGIVSIAAWQMDMKMLAWAMFQFNLLAYCILWALNIFRAVRYTSRVWQDLIDHQRATGFFTFVAATNILGGQFVLLAHNVMAGFILWLIGIGLWIVLTYTVFTAFTVKENKPPLERGINGAWLLAVVATQSVAVLSAILSAHTAQPLRIELNFLALSMWLWGGMLYIWMMSLIFYRYSFFRFSPGDLSPPYWINMGAMAISTLSGSYLIANTEDAPFLAEIAPFLKGFTVFYWATGTWWIPMLLILGVWRHIVKRFPLRYDPLYWGAVFPLGMYAVSTSAMVKVLDLGFLEQVSRIFFWVALAVWGVTLTAWGSTNLRKIIALSSRKK